MEHLWYAWQIPRLGDKLLEQLLLVGLSLFSAMIIGIPLGIIAQRFVWLRSPLLAITNIIQTIPSLALLAMLLPLFGIGMKPAIIALTLYAILPIVRNTLTGLQQISPLLLEVAEALGFTRWQRLRIVELPLAAPFIVTGIRTAVSMTVGIATIAAFIGAGGLGDFINRGLAMSNTTLLLLGAIPAALLALILDGLFANLEHHLNYLSTKPKKTSRRYWATWLVGIIFITGSIGIYHYQQIAANRNIIRIATKNFTEQNILGELMAQLITAKSHLTVERDFNLGTTQICQEAMQRGEIDIYPEYTGTAYMTILHQTQPLNATALLAFVKNAYAKQFSITWLAPFGFNNSQSLTVRAATAREYHWKTISDLMYAAHRLTLGAPAEFFDRPDGLPALKQHYHLHFAHIVIMDPGLMYHAIAHHQVDVINAFTTDGRIPAYHLQILQDNRHAFPAYQATPLIRNAVLKIHPEIAQILSELAGKISDHDMQQMNYEVDVEKKSPAAVATDFLHKKHLI